MNRRLLLALCLSFLTSSLNAQTSYFTKAYNYLFGACPSYSGEAFDIQERTGDGLNATYYNGTNFDFEVAHRIDPEIYFYYNGTSPSSEVNIYQFSVVWTGYLYAPKSTEYTLTTRVDDGIRLWVEGENLIDQWQSNAGESHSAKVKLEGKKVYELRIEYYQANKDARAELFWAYEGQRKQVIPQQYLFTSIKEPIVLLGPSFMSPEAQQKYSADTPFGSPSKTDETTAIVANIPNNDANTSTSNNEDAIAFAPSNDKGSNITNTPSESLNTRSSVNQSGITSNFPSIAQADVSSKIVTPSPQKIAKNEDTKIAPSNTDQETFSADLGSNINSNTGKDNSLLDKAIDKPRFSPDLSTKRPRRSGPIVLKNILFDKDRYRLKPSSYDELNALVDTLRNNPKLDVVIAGHTDYAGDPIPNKKLSESRAKAVAMYLIRHGINFKRIKTKGYGGTKPLSRAPLGTEERRRNKRVEYILIEKGAKP